MITDINSYRGDPALGGGYPMGGAPNPDNVGNQFQATLRGVFDNMARWNIAKFQQGIQDRDKLLADMSQTELPADMLDEDREHLSGEIQSLKDELVKNYDYAAKNPKGMIETQNKIKKLKEGIATSKTRWALITQKRLDYRDNPDPTFREALGKEISNDIKQGPYHIPAPYVRPDYYEPTVFASPALQASGAPEVYTKGGIAYTRQKVATPIDDFYHYYSTANMQGMAVDGTPQSALSSLKTITGSPAAAYAATSTATATSKAKKAAVAPTPQLKPWQIPTAYNFAANTEDYMKDDHLTAANARLQEIMQENGIQPGDPRYISEIATKGDDGNWKLIDDPTKWAIGQSLVANYQSKYDEQPDLNVQKQFTERARANSANASANLSNTRAGEIRSLLPFKKQQYEANINKLNQEARKAELTGDKTMYDAYEPVKSVYTTAYNEINKQGFSPLNETAIKNIGFSDGATFKEIPRTNTIVTDFLSVPKVNKTGRNDKYVPSKVYMVNDGGDIKFVGEFDPKTEQKVGKKFNVVSLKDAPSELINSRAWFNASDKENAAMGSARKMMETYIGQGGLPGVEGPAAASSSSSQVSLPYSDILKVPASDRRTNGDMKQVKYNGKWYNVKGRDKQNNYYLEPAE
jgi:hypothetical protein